MPVAAAFIGGVFGSVLSPWLTFRLSERNRRLDLYKIYYPLKVNAIKEINEGLIGCAISYGVFLSDTADSERRGEALTDLLDTQTKIRGLSCFIDKKTSSLADGCTTILQNSLDEQKDNSEEFWEAYAKLAATYPKTMHNDVFEKLF